MIYTYCADRRGICAVAALRLPARQKGESTVFSNNMKWDALIDKINRRIVKHRTVPNKSIYVPSKGKVRRIFHLSPLLPILKLINFTIYSYWDYLELANSM